MRLFNISYDKSEIVVKIEHTKKHFDIIFFCKNCFCNPQEATKKAQEILASNPDAALFVRSGKQFKRLITKISGTNHILLFKNTGALLKYKHLMKDYRIYCDFYISNGNYEQLRYFKDQLIWVKVHHAKECLDSVRHSEILNITLSVDGFSYYKFDGMLCVNKLILYSWYDQLDHEAVNILLEQVQHVNQLVIPYQVSHLAEKIANYSKLTIVVSTKYIKFIEKCEELQPDKICVLSDYKDLSKSKYDKLCHFIIASDTPVIKMCKSRVNLSRYPRWSSIVKIAEKRNDEIRYKRVRAIMPN